MKKTFVTLNTTNPLYQQPTSNWLNSSMLTPNGVLGNIIVVIRV